LINTRLWAIVLFNSGTVFYNFKVPAYLLELLDFRDYFIELAHDDTDQVRKGIDYETV